MSKRRLTIRNIDGRISLGREIAPHENIGNCFCGQPVYAAPGQSITYLTITTKARATGEVVKTERVPTHKACRKSRAKL